MTLRQGSKSSTVRVLSLLLGFLLMPVSKEVCAVWSTVVNTPEMLLEDSRALELNALFRPEGADDMAESGNPGPAHAPLPDEPRRVALCDPVARAAPWAAHGAGAGGEAWLHRGAGAGGDGHAARVAERPEQAGRAVNAMKHKAVDENL